MRFQQPTVTHEDICDISHPAAGWDPADRPSAPHGQQTGHPGYMPTGIGTGTYEIAASAPFSLPCDEETHHQSAERQLNHSTQDNRKDRPLKLNATFDSAAS
ncbi:uncharacterized protein PGTG_11763 [Puccinia graminis f. sp. tritici CRL 75-36-700-3]|uniref:Uncharacterized protein n=1 Tax=Puccinia graminis f. sp. tritici (strain CRL 75-36-700-3 / race SCCL) TaxID=418459 RepID=E3KM82_PUCGT|nr:uncharacterized protein PGTG_11763 [Puccinia graminis f. sp. tritici CRL 75-36-700-3]EFP85407.1 hypothetical protein PGTG_11763 [Puccinia graminis f. sp. tritici CRL 75-36-700-3]